MLAAQESTQPRPWNALNRPCSLRLQIYSKTGQWEDAVKVLDTLQAQVSAQLTFLVYTLTVSPPNYCRQHNDVVSPPGGSWKGDRSAWWLQPASPQLLQPTIAVLRSQLSASLTACVTGERSGALEPSHFPHPAFAPLLKQQSVTMKVLAAGHRTGGAHLQHRHRRLLQGGAAGRGGRRVPPHAGRRRRAHRHHRYCPRLRLRARRPGACWTVEHWGCKTRLAHKAVL